ncbi:hypothetical protein BDV95DRAFT_559971 [Massariosphaeria phaeospora]|uniref:Probable double zinc ribbon domain-containing protein n=1 Tax=Massariosphaeria phaeospora TaxID=100035 RepID=A0A7C8MG45_9PLEO|nr:hypothetical protein BDV95DRAFT_559971 [Massariosphaeria phaeospora]
MYHQLPTTAKLISLFPNPFRKLVSLLRFPNSAPKPILPLSAAEQAAEHCYILDRIALFQDAPWVTKGLWMCCHCGHITSLLHIGADNPFGKLLCPHCSHIWCPDCETTPHLLPFPTPLYNSSNRTVPTTCGDDFRVPFGEVCTECGITWRAHVAAQPLNWREKLDWKFNEHTVDGLVVLEPPRRYVAFATQREFCVCGAKATHLWPRFRIGKACEWCMDDLHR